MPPRTDDGVADRMGVLVDLNDLHGLAELPDEAAARAFGSISPEAGPTAGAGWAAGPDCAQRTSSGLIAPQAKPKAAPPAISAPVQSGGIFTHAFTHGTAGSAFTPHSVPLPLAQGTPEAVAQAVAAMEAMEQQQMVASYLQHHCSSRAARSELTEGAYSSVPMPKAAQQHQLVPNPMQHHSYASFHMPVAQQPSAMPQATQHPQVGQHRLHTLRQHPYLWQQSQYVPAATLQYSFFPPSVMSVAQQAEVAYASAAISDASALAEAQDFDVPSSLKAIFVNCVMCDYTPRNPKQFPSSRWTTLEELVSKLAKHAPVEVKEIGHQNLRQLITEWYKDHPKFRELTFSAWGKRLKDKTPGAHPRSLSFKFCFEYPSGLRFDGRPRQRQRPTALPATATAQGRRPTLSWAAAPQPHRSHPPAFERPSLKAVRGSSAPYMLTRLQVHSRRWLLNGRRHRHYMVAARTAHAHCPISMASVVYE